MSAVAHAPPAEPANAPPVNTPPPRGLAALAARFVREPNAIWMREMRQSARLGRTPWILFGLTLSLSLLMCTIGGLAAAEHTSPAQLGGALFQVFFSLANLVVVVVGPAIAANSIASEREGRTWEAVLLTGLSPKEIARGKFLAAYTTIALYIVVLAPVGALSFLFGGVTAAEVVVAFGFLFLVAGLGVAFGLAVSSLMNSLRGAIVVTLLLAVVIGPILYGIFGVGASLAVHRQWSDVPEGAPVWLPLAYTRATFGLEYVLFLVVFPLILVVVPAWFLYEVTISNLSNGADDKSSGLKRWFTVCTPLVAAACAAPTLLADGSSDRMKLAIFGLSAFALHGLFVAMLFTHEPPGPSRRVRIHWDRRGAGFWRRFFGPGLTKTCALAMLLVVLGTVGIAMTCIASIEATGDGWAHDHAMQVFVFAAYLAPFLVFVIGLNAYLRARGSSPWIARLVASGLLFLVSAGPWVVAAIGGVLTHGSEKDWLMVGAPSPFYAFVMISEIDAAIGPWRGIVAGLACATGWGALGLGLLTAAGRSCAAAMRQHDAAVAQADAALAAEDAAREAATRGG